MIMSEDGRMVTLLVVEDDELDVIGVKRALRALRVNNPVVVAKDGVDALDILRGQNGRQKLEAPYIILLDLNMPRMDGLEFLAVIRSDPNLRSSVVFVLTTSDDQEDIIKAYDHNVAGYIVKADPQRSFMDALKLVETYWTTVALPAS
ncbi:MAG: response regulator [Pseudomonadota bacterium]